MAKKIVLDELEIAPKVRLEEEVVVEEQKRETTGSEAVGTEAVIPQPIPEAEPSIDEDDSEEEKELFLEERAEAKEDLEDGVPIEGFNQPQTIISNPARVRDIDSDFEKTVMIIQGSDTTDDKVGGLFPFDMALTKLETVEEKTQLRLEAESVLEAASLFGRNSDLVSEFRESLKGDIMLSRANQGFLSKMLITNITQSFVDKQVRQDKREGLMKGTNPNSVLGGLKPDGSPNYSQNY